MVTPDVNRLDLRSVSLMSSINYNTALLAAHRFAAVLLFYAH